MTIMAGHMAAGRRQARRHGPEAAAESLHPHPQIGGREKRLGLEWKTPAFPCCNEKQTNTGMVKEILRGPGEQWQELLINSREQNYEAFIRPSLSKRIPVISSYLPREGQGYKRFVDAVSKQ